MTAIKNKHNAVFDVFLQRLYMCSLSALQFNKACREMDIRLEKNGKHHRVRKIAIANKLIKQAFSIVKNKTEYDKDFLPKVCF